MAERARRRMTAARASVSFAVAGVLAGWATSEGLPGAIANQVRSVVAPSSITSRQVKNHSLLYKDFKAGQVYSQRRTNKILDKRLTSRRAAATYLAKVEAANTYLQKVDAANTYLQKVVAANTYLAKIDARREFVGGNGIMVAGAQHVDSGAAQVLAASGLVTLLGNRDPAGAPDSITIRNTSGAPLDYATPARSGIIAVDQSVNVALPAGTPSQTVQISSFTGGVTGGVKVATLTLTATANGAGGPGTDFAAQAIIAVL